MNFTPSVFQAWAAALRGLTAAPRPAPATRHASVSQTEECRWGCGWFDSSHDLSSGLRVQELATPDGLAQALPLATWLELAGCGR